jgi:hypothetical protein
MAPATDPEASIGLAMEAGLQQKAQHVTASLRRIFFFANKNWKRNSKKKEKQEETTRELQLFLFKGRIY